MTTEDDETEIEVPYEGNYVQCPHCDEPLREVQEYLADAIGAFDGHRWGPREEVTGEVMDEYRELVGLYSRIGGLLREQLKC